MPVISDHPTRTSINLTSSNTSGEDERVVEWQRPNGHEVDIYLDPPTSTSPDARDHLISSLLQLLANLDVHVIRLTIAVNERGSSELFQYLQTLQTRHNAVHEVTWHPAGTTVLVNIYLHDPPGAGTRPVSQLCG